MESGPESGQDSCSRGSFITNSQECDLRGTALSLPSSLQSRITSGVNPSVSSDNPFVPHADDAGHCPQEQHL